MLKKMLAWLTHEVGNSTDFSCHLNFHNLVIVLYSYTYCILYVCVVINLLGTAYVFGYM